MPMDRAKAPLPPQRVNLVSPPFACGVAWLVNLLLALDIRVTNSGHPDHWLDVDGESHLGPTALDHLKWHLPILHERSRFRFQEAIDIRWEHRLDFARGPACPTILFVRDPRDAIHSLYRRQYEAHYSFPEYLARPDVWQDHFPELFRLPPFETFAYFVSYWLAMSARAPLLVIRFEDAKSDPVGTARRVLDFIGIQRPVEAIGHAVESSSFDNARKAMQTMSEKTGETFVTARRGRPGEWRESYDDEALAFVAGPVVEIMQGLGYATAAGKPGTHELPDIDVLIERQLDERSRPAAREAVACSLNGQPSPQLAIAQAIASDRTEEGRMRHALAALTLAAYYVDQIFPGEDAGSIDAKRLGLAAFFALNLRHMAHPSVRSSVRTTLFHLRNIPLAAS
jgi:hypothetical protein